MKQIELKNLLVLLHNWGISLINSEDKEITDSKLKVYETEYNRLKELYPHILDNPEKELELYDNKRRSLKEQNNSNTEDVEKQTMAEYRNIRKKYPIYFKLDSRKHVYLLKKEFCINDDSSELLPLLKETICYQIKYSPVLGPPHINYTNAVSRNEWDKMAIMFNLNPNEFKNKLEMHSKINEIITLSLNGQSLSDISGEDFDKKIETIICSTTL